MAVFSICLVRSDECVHYASIQLPQFIIRYQINHSPYDNEIGDLGNIAGKIVLATIEQM